MVGNVTGTSYVPIACNPYILMSARVPQSGLRPLDNGTWYRPCSALMRKRGQRPAVGLWAVQGKVVDLERRPDMVTMLRLDNGASLRATADSQGPGQPAQVGDSIMARYAESGGRDKIATQVRVIETQAP